MGTKIIHKEHSCPPIRQLIEDKDLAEPLRKQLGVHPDFKVGEICYTRHVVLQILDSVGAGNVIESREERLHTRRHTTAQSDQKFHSLVSADDMGIFNLSFTTLRQCVR